MMEYTKSKLFVASSSRAIPLAQALKSQLQGVAEVGLWFELFDPDCAAIRPGLLEQCQASDFAAVFLTQDDTRTKADNTGKIPRDNCIYELGLFTGALGLDPNRSFILTSVSKDALPTDLNEVRLIQIREPASLTKSSCAKSVAEAARQIAQAVRDLGPCRLRPLLKIFPAQHLVEMERPYSAGGQLVGSYDSEVVIHTPVPIELNHDLARTVCENMTADVSYRYFFEAEPDSVAFFASLVSTLAAAQLTPESDMNSEKWKELMGRDQNVDEVEKALKTMKTQLRICFLPEKPGLEFRVHDASHENEAICYLYNSADSFVEWSRGENAKQMADGLKTQRLRDQSVVFQGSSGLDLYAHENHDFLEELKMKTLGRFPDGQLRERAAEICFGY